MLKHGWNAEEEPFLGAVLRAVRAKLTQALSNNCRIRVPKARTLAPRPYPSFSSPRPNRATTAVLMRSAPASQGALLKGVIDETGVLPPRQVFIQISSRRAEEAGDSGLAFEGGSAVVEGVLALSKAPCHHPYATLRLERLAGPLVCYAHAHAHVAPDLAAHALGLPSVHRGDVLRTPV